MSSENTSALTFGDLILETAIKIGVAYYGPDGTQSAQIPADSHDLDLCQRLVNKAIKKFILDAPLPGWHWVHPVMQVDLWGTLTVDGTTIYITEITFDSATGLSTLEINQGWFWPTMELKTLTFASDGATAPIISVVSPTTLTLYGDWSGRLTFTPTNSYTSGSATLTGKFATLAEAIADGTTYTSISVSPLAGATEIVGGVIVPTNTGLTVAIPSGTTLTISDGSNTQSVTLAVNANVGDTSIAVNSFVANANYSTAGTLWAAVGTLEQTLTASTQYTQITISGSLWAVPAGTVIQITESSDSDILNLGTALAAGATVLYPADTFTIYADGNYTLPADFQGEVNGGITFIAGTNRGVTCNWVDEMLIRDRRANVTQESGTPYEFAVRQWAAEQNNIHSNWFTRADNVGNVNENYVDPQTLYDGVIPRRRWELMAYRMPAETLHVSFPYTLAFDSLIQVTDVPPSPYSHDETVKAACLALAEKEVSDTIGGPDWEYYHQICLPRSWSIDARSGPRKLGYFGNPSSSQSAYAPIRWFRDYMYMRPTVPFLNQ